MDVVKQSNCIRNKSIIEGILHAQCPDHPKCFNAAKLKEFYQDSFFTQKFACLLYMYGHGSYYRCTHYKNHCSFHQITKADGTVNVYSKNFLIEKLTTEPL